MADNGSMARKKSSKSVSRSPLTRTQETALPTEPVVTGSGLVRLEVDRDAPRCITVYINDAPSSFIDLDNPANVGFEYMEIMLTVLSHLRAGPITAVHLGAAGSTMARAIDQARPNSRQIGIDIDGPLLDYARTWFDLPRAPRLRLRTGDARAELVTMRTDSADVIIRDVFAGTSTPAHLTSLEFTLEVLRVLKPGGIYLVNCADRPPLQLARQEVATLWHAQRSYLEGLSPQERAQVIAGDVALISEPALLKGRRYGNLVLALTKPAARTDGPEAGPIDLENALLGRQLRSLAVPAHIASGPDSKMFARNAPVLKDTESEEPVKPEVPEPSELV